jgi:N-acetylneuraminate lyase
MMTGVLEKINGMICAPFTAFDENGEINLEAVPRYLEMLVDSGVIGVFVNGSTGEGYLMTDEERMLAAEKWVASSPAGFKVIVHVGSNSVKSSFRLAQHAQRIGAWGTGVMAPTFPNITRTEELAKYCEEIACGAPDLPFYFYHIPALSGVNLPMLPLLKAVDGRISNFAGIKYTYENLFEYTQCRRYKNGKFDLLHGQDETLLASLALGGATGCIGGTFNYAAGLYVGIREAFKQNDLQRALNLQTQAMDLIDVIHKYRGNIVAGKQIMKLIGLDLGLNRTPFQNMTTEEIDQMQRDLESIDFFEYGNRAPAVS